MIEGIERLRQRLSRHGGPALSTHRHWVVLEAAGGLIQRLESCIPPEEVVFIEVDFDELDGDVSEDESTEYYTEKLATLRSYVEPGQYRKFLRRRMAEAVRPQRGLGYEWAFPREEQP